MKYLSRISLFLAGICIVLFQLIGSYISADGILHEPFFLIPMMYLFLSIGIINYIIVLFRRLVIKK